MVSMKNVKKVLLHIGIVYRLVGRSTADRERSLVRMLRWPNVNFSERRLLAKHKSGSKIYSPGKPRTLVS